MWRSAFSLVSSWHGAEVSRELKAALYAYMNHLEPFSTLERPPLEWECGWKHSLSLLMMKHGFTTDQLKMILPKFMNEMPRHSNVYEILKAFLYRVYREDDIVGDVQRYQMVATEKLAELMGPVHFSAFLRRFGDGPQDDVPLVDWLAATFQPLELRAMIPLLIQRIDEEKDQLADIWAERSIYGRPGLLERLYNINVRPLVSRFLEQQIKDLLEDNFFEVEDIGASLKRTTVLGMLEPESGANLARFLSSWAFTATQRKVLLPVLLHLRRQQLAAVVTMTKEAIAKRQLIKGQLSALEVLQ